MSKLRIFRRAFSTADMLGFGFFGKLRLATEMTFEPVKTLSLAITKIFG